MKARKSLITLLLVVMLSFVLAFVAACTGDTTDSSGGQSSPGQQAQYTVTFNVDGATTTQTVRSGQTASRPADPQRDGFNFYGWYTEGNKPFSFDTLITGDITLFARMVSATVAANEFEVTFVKNGQTMSVAGTENGFVNALPADMGEGFIGWWVSDYEDADKLTYQYDGRQLKENTVFYAVYSSDAPTVSIKTSGISWSGMGVNKNYTVAVTDTHGNTLTRNTTALTFDYGFADREAGDYVVAVTVDGKTTRAYFKNKALPRVSHFEVNGSILVFNNVENADKYLLSVDCGNDEHEHEDMELNSSSFDFINCEMKEGGIKFTVTAVGEGFASSTSEFCFEQSLSGLNASVDASTDTLNWNAVAGASSYTVFMTAGGETTETFMGTDTSLSLKNYTGNMTFTVSAEARGYNPATSTVAYNKSKLATPDGLKVTADAFAWNAVAGATGYTLKINNKEYEVTAPSFDASELSLSVSGYTVSVKAKAADSANDSFFSDETAVKAKLDA
ncbi:MAG: InlB B-repeat-containing protein, partial [Clostridia bacterium]|nr:InlB B-repeat-containing protein [Clostridia bacterium]